MSRPCFWLLTGAVILFGCDSGDPYPPGEFVLTEGQETGTWSRDPAPVRATVDRIPEGASAEAYLTLHMPPNKFSLGSTGTASFEVKGFDASDGVQVWGRSYVMDVASLGGAKLPFFVQRTGELARPPGGLTLDHGENPPAAILGGRWLLVAGQANTGYAGAEAYDLGMWTDEQFPELRCADTTASCRPRTLAVVNSAVMVGIGDNWLRSYWMNEQSSTLVVSFVDADLPDGMLEWSEVAGGQVIPAPDGDVYVVATKTWLHPPVQWSRGNASYAVE